VRKKKRKTNFMKTIHAFLVLVILCFTITGCKNLTKSQKGVAIGAGAGGAIGAGVGKAAGNTALGAIIGATVGGAAGGIIGRQMDKQAQEIEQIPGAQVERVGEGINVTFDSGVLFAHDDDSINPDAQNKLTELSNILNKYPDTYILIEGHTDASGSGSYNRKLSKRRAESVADFLEQNNINDSRIRTKWYGEDQPKFPNDTADNMAKNRRVEFAIYANEELVSKAQQQAGITQGNRSDNRDN
jgi:outer membrane protein OmpA-like peptidoglycan-associated protein